MSKLRAFQFQPRNETYLDDVDNLGSVGAATENPSNDQDKEKTTTLEATPLNPSLSQKSMEKDARECPQTPIGRLPLSELIAGGNDINHPAVDLLPVERVLWNHSQQSCDPDGSQGRRSTKRGTKRAHSSSPSTSQNEPRRSLTKESSKLEKLPTSLKTPQVDPVNDLWSRYSLLTDKPSPTRRAETALASLHSSSPQTPTTHWQGKESGKLRRSYSCNIEWPTSATKRRKFQYSSSNQEATVGYATYEHGSEANGRSKMARVSLLVEQIQNRLARSSTQDDENRVDPSTLLPFLEKASFSTSAAVSPPQASETDGPETGNVLDHGLAPAIGQLQRPLPTHMGIANTTEYQQGELSPEFVRDDDYDEDDEDGVDSLASELLRTADDIEKYGLAVASPGISPSLPRRLEPSTSPCSPKDSPLGLDEFDDDDSETFAADLEDIVAKYDTRPQPQVQKLATRTPNNAGKSTKTEPTTFGTNVSSNVQKAPRVETGIKSGDISDEEFGGDFDFENIIAQCEEASQKPHSASRVQSSVCTRTFGPSM